MTVGMKKEVAALAKEAGKLVKEEGSPDAKAVKELYDRVDALGNSISREDMQATGLGKQLNLLRKKCTDKALARRGKDIVLRLRDAVSPRPQRNRKPPARLIDEWQPSEEQAGKPGQCPFVEAEVYEECKPLPKRNKHGELVFEDAPDFRPNLTPQEVLEAGAFGGGYFRTITSHVTGKTYKDAWKEFPKEWFANIDIKKDVASQRYNERRNKYRVKCGADKDAWEQKGWMSNIDPYGWFQWYCRFYLGRRSSDDARQLSRAKKCFSETGRWRINLCNKVLRASGRYDDVNVSPVVRQTLLHWGYQLTERDYKKHLKRYGHA